MDKLYPLIKEVITSEDAETLLCKASLKGSFDKVTFPHLLSLIYWTKESGTFKASHLNNTVTVIFSKGSPRNIITNHIHEFSLEQILLKLGKITEEQLEKVELIVSTTNKQPDKVLLELGIITPHELYNTLNYQAYLKLLNLFTWYEGEYFFIGEEELDEEFFINISPGELVLAGIKQHYDLIPYQNLFWEKEEYIITKVKNSPFQIEDLKLTPQQARLFTFIDNKKRLKDIFSLSKLNLADTLNFIYGLLILGIIELKNKNQKKYKEKVNVERLREHVKKTQVSQKVEKKEYTSFFTKFAEKLSKELGSFISYEKGEKKYKRDEIEDDVTVITQESLEDFLSKTHVIKKEEIKKIEDIEEIPTKEEITGVNKEGLKEIEDNSLNLFDKTVEVIEILDKPLKKNEKDYFTILNVSREDTKEKIQKSYLEIISKFNPENRDIKELSKITEAFQTLSNPKKRLAYERMLLLKNIKNSSNDEVSENDKEIANQRFIMAKQLINQGDLTNGEKIIEEAIELNPLEKKYHIYLGWCIFNNLSENEKEEIRWITETLEDYLIHNPEDTDAHYFLGKVYKYLKRYNLAKREFNSVIVLNPSYEEAKRELYLLKDKF